MAYLLVLLAAVLWGTTGTAQSFIEGTAHPMTIGAFRLMVGGFSLLLFVIVMKKLALQAVPWPATCASALSMALFQPLFFSSVQLTGIAIGTVVTIGSAPVLSGFIEWLIFRKRPDRVWVIATSAAVVGCVLLFANKEALTVDPLGVVMALGGGLSFAVYAIVSKQVLQKLEAIPAVALIFSLAALFLLPFVFFYNLDYLSTAQNWTVIVYLGIAATSLSYILFSTGLKRIPSSSAVTLSLAEPLTAALLGVLVVGEVLSAVSWAGVTLLLGGIIILTVGRRIS